MALETKLDHPFSFSEFCVKYFWTAVNLDKSENRGDFFLLMQEAIMTASPLNL